MTCVCSSCLVYTGATLERGEAAERVVPGERDVPLRGVGAFLDAARRECTLETRTLREPPACRPSALTLPLALSLCHVDPFIWGPL